MDAANTSTPAASPPTPIPPRTWPHAVQSTLFVVVVAAIIGVLTHSILQGSVQRPSAQPGEMLLTRIDLNHATRAELQLLPGVGEQMAKLIEAYRTLHGPYASVDELRKVPGIGALTIERLRPWLIVQAPSRTNPGVADISRPAAKIDIARTSQKAENLTDSIDLNTATAAELQKLPGIGPKLSQRIVDARAQGVFKNVDELRRVPGIGPKTIAKLRPYVTAGTDLAANR